MVAIARGLLLYVHACLFFTSNALVYGLGTDPSVLPSCWGVCVCVLALLQGRDLIVDGSTSFDPDATPGTLNFTWTCRQRQLDPSIAQEIFEFSTSWWLRTGVGGPSQCTTASGGSLLAALRDISAQHGASPGSVLSLAADDIPPSALLTFTLHLSKGSGTAIPLHYRSATATASLSFVPGSPPEVCWNV